MRRARRYGQANGVPCIPLGNRREDLDPLVWGPAYRHRDLRGLVVGLVRPRVVPDSVTFRVGSKKVR